jgi:anti-anti-sigma factor
MTAKDSGKINLETAVAYGTAIKDALLDCEDDIKVLNLDFSEITFISSIGLKVILELYKEMDEKGGMLKITGASEEVKKSFDMVGFDKFIVFE